jgi:hypothetical protein
MVGSMILLKRFLTITFIASLLAGFITLLGALIFTVVNVFSILIPKLENICFYYFNNPILGPWLAFGLYVFFICFIFITFYILFTKNEDFDDHIDDLWK